MFLAAFLLCFSMVGATSNLMELVANLNATIMLKLIENAGLSSQLATMGPYTIILPTDEAFLAEMTPSELTALEMDKARVKNFVMYHIIKGDIFSWDIPYALALKALNGHYVRAYSHRDWMTWFSVSGTVGYGSAVNQTTAAIVEGRVAQSGYLPDIFWLFFTSRPPQTVHFNNAKVLKHDLQASNGVIQLIDTVLAVPEGTVEEVLKIHGSLSMIRNVTFLAHLTDMLNSTRANHRYTLFAPSDSAFAKLDQTKLHTILSHTAYVRELLAYHIHPGTLHKVGLKNYKNKSFTTLLFGNHVHVTYDSNGEPLLQNLVKITTPDIECDNGVVHIIDRVLVPTNLINLGK